MIDAKLIQKEFSNRFKDSLQEKFFDQGTDEMTNYFVIEEALNYYKNIGGRLFLHDHADNLLEGPRVDNSVNFCQGVNYFKRLFL